MDSPEVLLRRFLAYLIDFILAIFLTGLFFVLFGHKNTAENGGGWSLNRPWGHIAFYTLPLLYYCLQEFCWQQTIGKRVFKLKVVKVDGSPLTFRDVLIRNFLNVCELFLLCVIAIFVVAVTRRRQRIGDLLANTLVISVKRPFSQPIPSRRVNV